MPFDDPSSRVEVVSPTKGAFELLDKVARKLSTPDRWLKYAREDAGAFCIYGAICDIAFEDPWRVIEPSKMVGDLGVAARALEAALPGPGRTNPLHHPLVEFNNHPATSHQDMLSLIARAKASLE